MSLETQILTKCPNKKCGRVIRTKKEETQCRDCGGRFDSKENEIKV